VVSTGPAKYAASDYRATWFCSVVGDMPACTPVLARTIQGMLWVLRLFPVPVGPEADNPTMFQLLSLPHLQLTGYNC